ncbi:hypothetical protein C6P45_001426 [Maudiozyma exigua]|uniref:Arrestin C-terminal-like domain-containing protein n=1 Tax=Maudiozyma exigua TaxID=34358 RepID=A0A9P6W1H9_MAUEX|nr:hypothetical protein C6P45_001426 [Kazachstania exigua]
MQIFSLSSKKKSPKKTSKTSKSNENLRNGTDLSTSNSNSGNTGLNSTSKKEVKPTISYYDIRIDSPYKDLILIQGTPLESQPISLSGKLIFSLNEDIQVKRIRLRLVGKFKLEFLQMSKKKGSGGMTSIVKEQQSLIECEWDNLLRSPKGYINVNNISGYNTNNRSDSATGLSSTAAAETDINANGVISPGTESPVKKNNNKFRISGKQGKRNTKTFNLPEGGYSGTPYPDLKSNNTKYTFTLPKGNYELPFMIQLPSDIPETVEGLQSSSILYTMEGIIDRRKKTNLMMLNETDKRNLNAILSTSSSIISSGYDSNVFSHSLNLGSKIFTKYKYLRILRTLSSDNLAMQEEMSVGNTLLDKLQYEIKIPSRAIPIGGKTPIQIKIFPFQKNYMLSKISLSLLQYYSMKDSDSQIYEDEVLINRQSMTEFGDLVEAGTNRLIDKFELFSEVQLPGDLRRVTQDCDIKNDYIHVHHKLLFHIILKRTAPGETTAKNLEIKASIPVLLFVSPQLPMKGRLVLFDQMTGKIHFRTGKLVSLFPNIPMNSNNSYDILPIGSLPHGYQWTGAPSRYFTTDMNLTAIPPPNYQERTNDQLIQLLEGAISNPLDNVPVGQIVEDNDTNVPDQSQQLPIRNDYVTHSNETTNYEQPPPPPIEANWQNPDSASIPEYSETP